MSHALVQVVGQHVEGALGFLLCQHWVLVGVLLGQVRAVVMIQQMVTHTEDEGKAGSDSRIAQDSWDERVLLGLLLLTFPLVDLG